MNDGEMESNGLALRWMMEQHQGRASQVGKFQGPLCRLTTPLPSVGPEGSLRRSFWLGLASQFTVYRPAKKHFILQRTKLMLRQGRGLSTATQLEAEPKPAPPHTSLPSLGAASWTWDALTSQSQRALWEILRACLCTGDSLSLSLFPTKPQLNSQLLYFEILFYSFVIYISIYIT